MISKATMKTIDEAIKEVWISNIAKDYSNYFLLKEDSLKCCFYYHLRRKLATLLKENNLRIYSEYYFSDLRYKADIVIVEIAPYCGADSLKDMIAKVVAIIELKYDGGNSDSCLSICRYEYLNHSWLYRLPGLCRQFRFIPRYGD